MLNFTNGKELLEICRQQDCTISKAMIDRETRYFSSDEASVRARMAHSYDIMKEAVQEGQTKDIHSMGGLIGGEAKKISAHREQTHPLCGYMISKAMSYAMGVLEVNASMGLIVAAPTAGSSGVIPGVFCAWQEEFGFSDEQMV